MDAGYIQKIVKNIDSLPYKAIMFDGKWGIGKSYAVGKALDDRENVCNISVFGMKSVDRIALKRVFDNIVNTTQLFAENEFSNLEKVYNYFGNAINCFAIAAEKAKIDRKDFLDDINYGELLFFLRNHTYEFLNLSHYDLSGRDFSRLIFVNINLTGADMGECDLSHCDFTNANMEKCNLVNANLFCAKCTDTNFSYADLRGAHLNYAVISKRKEYFRETRINIEQMKWFWPEISMFMDRFMIYVSGRRALRDEIEEEAERLLKMV